jgi:hypothetical protein
MVSVAFYLLARVLFGRVSWRHSSSRNGIFRYPKNCVMYEIGKSVENRSIVGIRIGTSIRRRKLLKPMVKIVANMHGNEVRRRQQGGRRRQTAAAARRQAAASARRRQTAAAAWLRQTAALTKRRQTAASARQRQTAVSARRRQTAASARR